MPGGQLCFWNFSFLTESGPYISAGFKKPEETVRVQSDCSINKLYVDIQPEKRKPTVFFFETNGWDTSLDSKSENKYPSDSSRACLFFVCNNTSASGNFICLSSHGKILAESFQFDWKENIFYKLEKYIQPDCMTTNQPSHLNRIIKVPWSDPEKSSFTQLKPENTTRRIMEKITFSIFQNENLN